MARSVFGQKQGQTAATTAIAQSESSEPEAEPEPETTEEVDESDRAEDEPEQVDEGGEEAQQSASVSLSAGDLTNLLNRVEEMSAQVQVSQQQAQDAQAELATAREQLAQAQESQQQAQQTAQESQAAVNVLNRLTQLTGVSVQNMSQSQAQRNANAAPHIARLTSPELKAPGGAYGDFARSLDSAPSHLVRISGTRQTEVRDTRAYDQIARNHVAEVRRGLEEEMRSHGLLQGNATSLAQVPHSNLAQASTSGADVLGYFLPRISSLLRLNNAYQYVFHNWVYHEFAFGRGQGTVIQFPRRGNLLPKPTSREDRLLSSNNTFVPISTNTRPVQAQFVSGELKEYGLGRAGIGDPIGYVVFTEMYSLVSLLSVINDTLVDDYYCWLDLSIRSIFQRTSRVAWNKNGTLVDDPSLLAAGDGCELSYEFLIAASMYLETLGVPKMNGYYVCVIPSTSVRGFIASIDDKLDLVNEANQQIVRDVIATHTGPQDTIGLSTQLVSGLVGIVGNVIVVRSNAYGVGQPGSDGTQSETIAGNTVVTRSCYMFGAGAVARGIGMPMEVRTDMSPFEREERCIWTSHEAHIQLDVDSLNSQRPTPPGGMGEETRVIELRVTDGSI